ncbi:hypothetical protein PISMIDRAFT_686443 [Pisolithus microcarpus 441]|uniref:Uncharacterized protein n=1 Tax=Pisolithus microcarpus 441 TaxID=765257 RepID=A0A0C9YHV8_9AGAM|nr:hypothetical protein PISMIDRAFT_686443 [Pisolithus microcarpus 441]
MITRRAWAVIPTADRGSDMCREVSITMKLRCIMAIRRVHSRPQKKSEEEMRVNMGICDRGYM